MKQLLGKTDLWRFPIMCEETWIGVEREAYPTRSNIFENRISMENNHVPSSQQIAYQAPVIA
jgi:hypothetical protein